MVGQLFQNIRDSKTDSNPFEENVTVVAILWHKDRNVNFDILKPNLNGKHNKVSHFPVIKQMESN